MTCWGQLCRGWRFMRKASACRFQARAGMCGARWPTTSSSDAPPSARCGHDHAAGAAESADGDRKSTRLNSSHEWISYAVFCLEKTKGPGRRGRREENEERIRAGRAGRGRGLRAQPGPLAAGPAAIASVFFFNDTATTEIYTLSLHDALPI